MKPAAFEYTRPRSLDEALEVLAAHGDDATPLAGGQSLVPMMNLRLARPAMIVDLNEVTELGSFDRRGDELVIGALARQRDVERSAVCAELCPLLAEALWFVGNPQTRNRGTIGGNLAHADPTSELPAVVAACGGTLVLASLRGRRELSADEFFRGPYMNCRDADELLVEVRLPAFAPTTGWAFEEVAHTFTAHAIVAVAAVCGGAGMRIGVSGVPGSPRLITSPDQLADVSDPYRRAVAVELAGRTTARAAQGAA